ncbi:DUF2846 domain-containing protein [Pantoea sp.]|uniref:DUF2846 domain-containing protein n=1 Tax=Pantoea sp. TaxID=69393 RepID=UPI0031CFC33D
MPALRYQLIKSIMFAGLMLPAAAHSQSFGEPYRAQQKVTAELSQIIFYRQNAAVTAYGGASVYLDGKMHTSLLPGGYTAFCVQPGAHTLGVRLSSSLIAAGQQNAPFHTNTKAGKTYFFRIDEQALMNQPAEARSAAAGDELLQTRRQSHLLSRATSIVPCAYDYTRTQPRIDYLLPSDSLFLPDNRLSQRGREAIGDLAVQIRRNHSWINQVRIIDTAINHAANDRQMRETQLRQALIEAALPANSIKFVRDTQPQQSLIILQVD